MIGPNEQGPVAPIVPRVGCLFCGQLPLRYVPSGPSGLRLQCDRCRVVVVIPRAQLRRVAARLTQADRSRVGW